MTKRQSKKRVAIFGGAFDPPHLGHVLATQFVLATTDVDEVWWMPCYQHYFAKKLSPFADRLAMCKLAVASLPKNRVRVSDFESRHRLDGRTLLTLQLLKKKNPAKNFIWIIGSDNVAASRRWYKFSTIAKKFGFVVVPRGGTLGIPAYSSSSLRRQLRARTYRQGGLSLAVWSYIRRRRLYS